LFCRDKVDIELKKGRERNGILNLLKSFVSWLLCGVVVLWRISVCDQYKDFLLCFAVDLQHF
jgi:hypothetical protein